MSKNKMEDCVVNQSGFNQDVLELVRQRVSKSGDTSADHDYQASVSVTGMVKRVSSTLMDYLTARGHNVPVTGSDIESALCTIVETRVMQLNRALPRGIHSMDVPIPDFFRPVVTRLCKFEDPSRFLEITPKMGPSVEERDDGGATEGASCAIFQDRFDHLVRVCRLLKANGVGVTNALPKELITGDDSIFRIYEDEKGELFVAGADVSEVDVLVRSIIRLEFLQVIFGAARSRYVSVEDLRSAWDAVVSTGFVRL